VKIPTTTKKGHAKWVLEQVNGEVNVADVDDPSIMQHLMPITPNPRNNPMPQMRNMVYHIGQEVLTPIFSSIFNGIFMSHFKQIVPTHIVQQAAAHFTIPRVRQPLPEESAFVVAGREELPPARGDQCPNKSWLNCKRQGKYINRRRKRERKRSYYKRKSYYKRVQEKAITK
jgi:hypothetical protein